MEEVLAKYQHLEVELDKKFDIIDGRLKDKCDSSRATQFECRLIEAEDRQAKFEQEVKCEVTKNATKVEAHLDNLEHRMSTVESTVQSIIVSKMPDDSMHFDDEEEKEEKEK